MIRKTKGLKSISALILSIIFFFVMSSCGGSYNKGGEESEAATEEVEDKEHPEGEEHPAGEEHPEGEEHPADTTATEEEAS